MYYSKGVGVVAVFFFLFFYCSFAHAKHTPFDIHLAPIEQGNINNVGYEESLLTRVRTVDYIEGFHHIEIDKNFIVSRVVYYNQLSKDFVPPYETPYTNVCEIGRDGCVARLVFAKKNNKERIIPEEFSEGGRIQALIKENNRNRQQIESAFLVHEKFANFDEPELLVDKYICNKKATLETKALYYNLIKIGFSSNVLYGHNSAFDRGRTGNILKDGRYEIWESARNNNTLDVNGRPLPLDNVILQSDVTTLTGEVESVYAVDLRYCCGSFFQQYGDVAFPTYDKELYRRAVINNIKAYYKRHKGVIMCTAIVVPPMAYPNGNESVLLYKDPSICRKIVDNIDSYADWYYEQIDELCSLFNQLVDESGRKIPVILRLLHEQTRSGAFWWVQGGYDYAKRLWRNTVDHINGKCNNVLYEWNVEASIDAPMDIVEALYPGDDYCDCISVDYYGASSQGMGDGLKRVLEDKRELQSFCNFANSRAKFISIRECSPSPNAGIRNCENERWFTDIFYDAFNLDATINIAVLSMWWNNVYLYCTPLQTDGKIAKNFIDFFSRKDIIKSPINGIIEKKGQPLDLYSF